MADTRIRTHGRCEMNERYQIRIPIKNTKVNMRTEMKRRRRKKNGRSLNSKMRK